MTPDARIAAAIDVLDRVLSGEPAEKALTNWARRSRFAGSKDRAALRDLVFDALRCRRSFAALGGAETGRGLIIGAARDGDWPVESLFTGEGYAPARIDDSESGRKPLGAEALDCPDWLWPRFQSDLADPETTLTVLRSRAPTFVRVATRLATRDQVIASLASDQITAVPHDYVSTALEVTENARKISSSKAYLSGRIELQDAASQAAILRLPAAARVLDYCAGGGGKALALADRGARVWAHDIDPARMRDLPVRASRAGVEIPVVTPKALTRLEPFDLVFCDAPCSGSGTWRRTPEAKWRLTAQRLDALCDMQRDVLAKARTFVRPDGYLAYATCSIFRAENQDQVARFLNANPDFTLVDEMELLPDRFGDGFYLALLKRASKQP